MKWWTKHTVTMVTGPNIWHGYHGNGYYGNLHGYHGDYYGKCNSSDHAVS